MRALSRSLETGGGEVSARGSSPSSSGISSLDRRLLGFRESTPPEQLFTPRNPPGMLALDAMVFFARNQRAEYHRLVLDQMSREEAYQCPFVYAGLVSNNSLISSLIVLILTGQLSDIFPISDIQAVGRILCNVLGVTGTESERFFPMLFNVTPNSSHGSLEGAAFNEMFGVSIQLFFKTWKEMEANINDFDKVVAVVRKQLDRILNKPFSEQPRSIRGGEGGSLHDELQRFPYKMIQEQVDREHEDRDDDKCPMLRDLR